MLPCSNQIEELGFSPFVAMEIEVEKDAEYEVSLSYYLDRKYSSSNCWSYFIAAGIKVCSPSVTVCPGRTNKNYQTESPTKCIFSKAGSERQVWTKLSHTFVASDSTITVYLAKVNDIDWYADAINVVRTAGELHGNVSVHVFTRVYNACGLQNRDLNHLFMCIIYYFVTYFYFQPQLH